MRGCVVMPSGSFPLKTSNTFACPIYKSMEDIHKKIFPFSHRWTIKSILNIFLLQLVQHIRMFRNESIHIYILIRTKRKYFQIACPKWIWFFGNHILFRVHFYTKHIQPLKIVNIRGTKYNNIQPFPLFRLYI